MACCGNKNFKGSNVNNDFAPQVISGDNQRLLKQIEDQRRQQAEIVRVIEQSNNPNKTLIKTYH